MVAPLGSTLGAAGDGELLVLRSKLGIPSAANDQSGRLATAKKGPVPRRARVAPRLRFEVSAAPRVVRMAPRVLFEVFEAERTAVSDEREGRLSRRPELVPMTFGYAAVA